MAAERLRAEEEKTKDSDPSSATSKKKEGKKGRSAKKEGEKVGGSEGSVTAPTPGEVRRAEKAVKKRRPVTPPPDSTSSSEASDSEASSRSSLSDSDSSSASSSPRRRSRRRRSSKSRKRAKLTPEESAEARSAKKAAREEQSAFHKRLRHASDANWWKLGSLYCDQICAANRRREALQDKCELRSWAFASEDALRQECEYVCQYLSNSLAPSAHKRSQRLRRAFDNVFLHHRNNHGRSIVLQNLVGDMLVTDSREAKRRKKELRESEAHYKAMAKRHGALPTPAPAAMQVAQQPPPSGGGGGRGRRAGGGKFLLRQEKQSRGEAAYRSDVVCYGCGYPGHIQRDCVSRNRQDSGRGDDRGGDRRDDRGGGRDRGGRRR